MRSCLQIHKSNQAIKTRSKGRWDINRPKSFLLTAYALFRFLFTWRLRFEIQMKGKLGVLQFFRLIFWLHPMIKPLGSQCPRAQGTRTHRKVWWVQMVQIYISWVFQSPELNRTPMGHLGPKHHSRERLYFIKCSSSGPKSPTRHNPAVPFWSVCSWWSKTLLSRFMLILFFFFLFSVNSFHKIPPRNSSGQYKIKPVATKCDHKLPKKAQCDLRGLLMFRHHESRLEATPQLALIKHIQCNTINQYPEVHSTPALLL